MDSDAIKQMQAEIAAAVQAEEELFEPAEAAPAEIDLGFVRSCLYNEERGDGILFAHKHQDRLIMVKNWGKDGQWLYWDQHHWVEDKLDLAHNAVEEIAQEYHRLAVSLQEPITEAKRALAQAEAAIKTAAESEDKDHNHLKALSASKHQAAKKLGQLSAEHKKATTRVDKLRKMGGAVNCLNWATRIGSHSLSILGEHIDRNPWLLACANGVLDLRTAKFSPGRPRDYLLKSIAVDWLGLDTPCPTWDAFFAEIHQHDPEVIDFLYRLFGYALTGHTSEHFIGFFLGDGRNGKGTMFELLRYLMGDLGWSISPELILEQKNARSSAGPSPDLMSLHGRRIVIASESDENRRVSLERVKRLTGGDTINARAPHDRFETNITPTWKLFFYTNHVPSNIARDFAMRQRLVYLQYPLKFVDDPDPADPNQRRKNPELPGLLRDEASGILARLVRGCLEWQQMGGLHPPAKIRADIDDLAKHQDTFHMFFAESVRDDDQGWVTFKDLYDRFCTWYEDEVGSSDKYRPTKKAVSQWLEKRGYERRKPSGIATVYGITLREPEI